MFRFAHVLLRTLAVLAMATACACTTYTRNLPPTTKFDEQSRYAIIVLKVEPLARVLIAPGIVDRNGWQMVTAGQAFGAWAEEGIIILEVNPRTEEDTYGVTMVAPDDGSYASYFATKNVLVPVFRAPAGQVTYVGAIRIERSGESDGIRMEHNDAPDDGEMVALLMKRRYPKIRTKVVPLPYEMIRRYESPHSFHGSLVPTQP
jgi:hypothetical protein